MCGICGFLATKHEAPGKGLGPVVEAMAGTLSHRGPDDAGSWIDAGAGLALGHRRLSIIDLSDAGRQPMVSACGRFVITYNGEIYNFRDLRQALEQRGHVFRGSSDTEVLLGAIAEWGIEPQFRRPLLKSLRRVDSLRLSAADCDHELLSIPPDAQVEGMAAAR